jgi:NADH-quinone oxidoreductase subunit H
MSFSESILELLKTLAPVFSTLFFILCLVVPLLISMAYLTYAERRVIAAMQMRKGPNVVGPLGLLQPFSDALKLILKEVIIPNDAGWKLFLFAPIITFTLAMICWAVIPISFDAETNTILVIADINVGITYLLAISSLSVYGIVIAGYVSNSKYAFLGAMRSAAQMISYELSIGFSMMLVLLYSGSLNLGEIVVKMHYAPWWFWIMNLPMLIMFLISMLAETNRHPFDLPESEAELVAGYNVEYSSMSFALFYLGEYLNMILASAMISIVFLGGWYPPFDLNFLSFIPGSIWYLLKMAFILFIFIWIRAALPRYRYDQLMRIGWKFMLPGSLIWLAFGSSVLFFSGNIS